MLEVTLLGQFDVICNGKPITIPTRHAQSLFAFLVLRAGIAHRREKLAGLLWPESSEENSRSNLRHELWRLRKSLETEEEKYFLVDDLTIAFNAHSEYFVDAHALENTPREGGTIEALIRVLSRYQGELLPGFYEEWVVIERARLAELYEARMAHLLDSLQTARRWPEVMDWGMRWISLFQWPEPAYRALMMAYANTGDLSKAAAIYERFAQGVLKDLGIKPSQQTQALYQRLKAGQKVISQDEDPIQNLPPEPQTPAAIPTTFPLPRVSFSNLPKPLTSFIGRDQEIQQVSNLLSRARLVTITGAGGLGKTRLAIQTVGSLASHFRDGICWIDLASLSKTAPSKIRDPSQAQGTGNAQSSNGEGVSGNLIAQVIAKILQIPEVPGLTLLEGVIKFLRVQHLLLVLDNCEHLLEDCASLVEQVLTDCPRVTFLATSREALGVPGEITWRLPALSLPEQESLLGFNNIPQSEAVSLFIERARNVFSGYQPGEVDLPMIAQICLRLDGIPLAIELAAARMNMLSVQEINARLDHRFDLLTDGRHIALPRHQTLHAAIEWSYDLLEKSEQILFRRLAIFAGSFSLEAAEALCTSHEISKQDVLFLFGRLVDKSLLNVEHAPQDTDLATRYRFLDTIRSFGRLKLDEARETRLMRDRHASHYVRLVEAAESELLLRSQIHWFKLLEAENDNLRAVFDWSAESDQAECALRLAGCMMWPWFSIGSSREGLDLALQALELPSAAPLNSMRARALNTTAFLQWAMGEIPLARQFIEQALSILEGLNDDTTLAWSKQILGLVLLAEGEYSLADRTMKEGIAISHQLDDFKSSCLSLAFRGDIALQQGDPTQAQSIYEESTRLLRAFGNKNFLAYPLRRLGYVALEQNDYPKALNYFRESLLLNHEVGDHRAVAACVLAMASLAMHQNKPLLAAKLCGAVESWLKKLSILLSMDQAELGRVRSQLPHVLDPATLAAAFTQGCEMGEERTLGLVWELFGEKD